MGLTFAVALLLVAGSCTNSQTSGKVNPVLALHYSKDSGELTMYSTEDKTVLLADGTVLNKTPLDENNRVTGIATDDVVGTVTVNYFTRCLTLTSPPPQQSVSSIGQCTGKTDNVTIATIDPYGVTIGPNKEIVFTDEFSNTVKIWIPERGSLQNLIDDSQLNRPRGIAYDDSTDSYYVTISNGVYSSKDKKVIAGVADELDIGLKDGPMDQTRFSYPTGITSLTPGLLAVADYSNNRVRLVNTVKGTVTSFCSSVDSTGQKSCNIAFPISLAVSKDLTKFYVGTSTTVIKPALQTPTNLCYGLNQSAEATITVEGKSMKVWCDLDTADGPWITLMRRYDGSQAFNKSYAEYTSGFGKASGEYWLGLENIYLLTKNREAKLRIDIEAFKAPTGKPTQAFAIYNEFWLGNNTSGYALEKIDQYSGNAGDMEASGANATSLGGPHRGQSFSTYDKDADNFSSNCAAEFNGGWWFNQCYTACLTCGPYTDKRKRGYAAAMIYYPYTERKEALKSSSMKIKLPSSLAWVN